MLARALDGSTAAHVAVQLGNDITTPLVILRNHGACAATSTVRFVSGYSDVVLLMLRWISRDEEEQQLLKLGFVEGGSKKQHHMQVKGAS